MKVANLSRPLLASLMFLCIMTNTTKAQTPSIRDLAFSKDGKFFAACASTKQTQGQLAVWDADGELKFTRKNEEVGYPKLAFSPDSKLLALARFDMEGFILDASTGDVLGKLVGHTAHVRSITFTPDGKQIITGGYDGTIRIWDAATFELQHTIEHAGNRIYSLAVTPDGKTLAVADAKNYLLKLFDLETREQTFVSDTLISLVPNVTVSPDGNHVIAASWGGFCRVFDLRTLEHVGDFHGGQQARYSPDGTLLAIATRTGVVVHTIGGAGTATQEKIQRLIKDFESDDYNVRVAAENSLKVIGPASRSQFISAMRSENPEVRVRCRRLHEYLMTREAGKELQLEAESDCSTFSPDSKRLAAGDRHGNITLWNVADWSKQGTVRIPAD